MKSPVLVNHSSPVHERKATLFLCAHSLQELGGEQRSEKVGATTTKNNSQEKMGLILPGIDPRGTQSDKS